MNESCIFASVGKRLTIILVCILAIFILDIKSFLTLTTIDSFVIALIRKVFLFFLKFQLNYPKIHRIALNNREFSYLSLLPNSDNEERTFHLLCGKIFKMQKKHPATTMFFFLKLTWYGSQYYFANICWVILQTSASMINDTH